MEDRQKKHSRQNRWRAKHKVRLAPYRKAYAKANKDRINCLRRKRRASAHEKFKLKVYAKTNELHRNILRRQRRARKRLELLEQRVREKLRLLKLEQRHKRRLELRRGRYKRKPGYYKQWYQKRVQQGLCTVCSNPAEVTYRVVENKPSVYCEQHKEKHRIRAYNKRGIFGTTDKQAKILAKASIVTRMKTELGNHFDEVKDFIESNLDLFKEVFDRPIALSYPLQDDYESFSTNVDNFSTQDRLDNL